MTQQWCSIVVDTIDVGNPATPHYNNALLQDMNGYHRHLHDIFNASQDCTAFTDALMLFKVWLRQREFYDVCVIQLMMVAGVLEITYRAMVVVMAF